MASRYLVALGLSAWVGRKADAWLGWDLPLCVWLFPLATVLGLLVKAVLDTSDTPPRT